MDECCDVYLLVNVAYLFRSLYTLGHFRLVHMSIDILGTDKDVKWFTT